MAFGASKKKVETSKKAAAELKAAVKVIEAERGKPLPVKPALVKDVLKEAVKAGQSDLDVLAEFLKTPINLLMPVLVFNPDKKAVRPWGVSTTEGVQLCAPTLAYLVAAMR